MTAVPIEEVIDALTYVANRSPTRWHLLERIKKHGIASPDGVDWKEMYRIQTAMRYMDAMPALTKQGAYQWADSEIAAAISAAAPKQENSNE